MTVPMLILLGCAIVLGARAVGLCSSRGAPAGAREESGEGGGRHRRTSRARSALLQRAVADAAGAAREALDFRSGRAPVGTRADLCPTRSRRARACKEGTTQGAGDQRNVRKSTQYKHAINLSRLQNQLATEIDRAALRPLRIEAQRTRLRVEANERVVESIFSTQQADR